MSDFLRLLNKYEKFIPDFDNFLKHLYHPLPTYFRINTIKIDIHSAKEYLLNEGVEFSETKLPEVIKVINLDKDKSLLSYYLGYIYPQTISSCIPVIALSPKQDETILDLCAAPGGKTTYIAQLMNDNGLIIANDRKKRRITALLSNVKRLGITNTIVIQGRGEHLMLPIKFDKVLVDAPCSGQGKYRIDPISGRVKHMNLGKTNLSAIQKALIKKGFDMLRPGGTLVYSTCTLNIEENEEVVDHLLKKREGKLQAFDINLPSCNGITSFGDKRYDDSIKLCKRFYPHQLDSVGFFVAKIIKKP